MLLLAMFGSGFSALTLEVLWTKQLSLTFGSTIWAAGVVIATFMAGLALGGALFGRLADRSSNPLRLYAALELGIALSAFLFRPALRLVELGYLAAHGQTPLSHVSSTLLLLSFCAMLLLPPTLCMGGTLPVIGRLLKRVDFEHKISLLYASNVIGAAVGAFLAGYVLIPVMGMPGTELIACTLNLMIAAAFWWRGRTSNNTSGQAATTEPAGSWRIAYILPCTFLAGASALALQLLWTRVLVLFLGSSTYAFSSILSLYLVSMAAGGASFSFLKKKFASLPCLFAGLAILSAVYLLCSLPFYDQLTYALLKIYHWSNQSWLLYNVLLVPIVFLVVGSPAFLSGAMFPAALAIYSPKKGGAGRRVGSVVLYNTLGGVVGSLAGAFWIIPQFGLLSGFKLIAGGLLLIAALVAFGQRHSFVTKKWVFHFVLAAIAGTMAIYPWHWDVKLMNEGMYYYASEYPSPAELRKHMDRQVLLANFEGTDATVTVREDEVSRIRYFTVNGKVDGGTGDMVTQILLGQLPIILHPNPQDVLVIGLGTGVTLGAIAHYPARSIDCVEISPAVIAASDYFREVSNGPLSDPRVSLHVQDARNFLLLQREKRYDVITSEPSNPWQAGNANLFTAEFFRIVRDRLNPGGVFFQWLPLYDLTSENLRAQLRTFSEIFPEAHLFINGSDLFMLGSAADIRLHYQGALHRLSRYYSTARLNVIDNPAELLAKHYLFSGELVRDFGRGARMNTDLDPVLEYSSRYNLGDQALRTRRADQNRRDLYGVVDRNKQALPITGLGDTEEAAHATEEIVKSFMREQRARVTIGGQQ